jgi:hypothetical protein
VNFRSRPLRKAFLAAALATTVASGLLVSAASADVTTTPPWQETAAKDPNNITALKFYDANGAEITTGSTTTAFPYVVAAGNVRAGDDHATLFAYTPVEGKPQGAWSGEQLTATGANPLTSPPAALPTGKPAVKGTTGSAGDVTLAQYIAGFPNASNTAGYKGVYELRLRTSSVAQGVADQYAVADVVVTGTTWTVYGIAAATTTTLEVPATANYGAGFVVTATVATASGTPTGNVTLKDGAATVGSAVALDSSGHATFNVPGSALTGGTHSLTAVYAGNAAYATSTSTAGTITIAEVGSTTTVTPQAKAYYGTAYKVATAVTGPAGTTATGTVTLKTGTATVATATLVSGKATFTIAGTKFAPGTRSFNAVYNGSTSLSTSTAAAKNLVISKAVAKAVNALSPKTIKHTKAAKLTVKVTATGVFPAGRITIFDGTRVIKTVTLTTARKGVIVVALPKLKKGSHKIHAVYAGSTTVLKATAATVTLKST